LLDFSRIDDLKPLARLIGRIKAIDPEGPFIIAGAQARDLLLKYAHGIETGRQTADIDFAFRVQSWDEFRQLRDALIDSGDFIATRKSAHKLLFKGTMEVDIVPFGGIENVDRTIAWPPDGDFVMSVFGFREIADSFVTVQLPENESANVVTLPALALLKIEAWRDRRLREPGKDAHDLRIVLTNYLNAGNADRLSSDFADLLEDERFDYELAGAYVLGNDIAGFLDETGATRILKLLNEESDPQGKLRLAGDMRIDADRALGLIQSLEAGFLRRAGLT